MLNQKLCSESVSVLCRYHHSLFVRLGAEKSNMHGEENNFGDLNFTSLFSGFFDDLCEWKCCAPPAFSEGHITSAEDRRRNTLYMFRGTNGAGPSTGDPYYSYNIWLKTCGCRLDI